MLLVFCNLVEVMRLRENLIMMLTESVALTDIYNTMKDYVKKGNIRLYS
jgi:hypothetical protein